jgi:hypothetical protein
MGKITGVAKKPIAGKRDGLLHWRVYWTPYKGAEKLNRWIVAPTRLDASHELKKLMATYGGKVKDSGLPSDFGLMLTELKKSLNSDIRHTKTVQQYEKVFNRVFVDFKVIYEAEHKVSIASLPQIDYTYFVEYKDYFMLKLKRERGWHNELIRIKSMLNHLRRKKFCSRELVYDVREELETPPSNTVPYRDIPESTLDKLFAYIRKDRPDYYLPYRYMFLTGRRPRETTLYERTDVEGGVVDPILLRVRAEITKTKTDGEVHLKSKEKGLEELQSVIREALRGNNRKWLFRNRHNRRCAVDKLYQYLKETSKNIIGVTVTPKYFRKWHHTNRMKKDMKNTMALSGLKDVKVAMMHYNYSSAEGQAKVLAKPRKR